jgi:hypothetical protein
MWISKTQCKEIVIILRNHDDNANSEKPKLIQRGYLACSLTTRDSRNRLITQCDVESNEPQWMEQ